MFIAATERCVATDSVRWRMGTSSARPSALRPFAMAARPPRVARAAVAVTVGLVLVMLGACGDDGDDDTRGGTADGDRTEPEDQAEDDSAQSADDWPVADGVTVEATAAPGGDHVAITFTVTNTDGATIAVPDPATTPDRVGEAPDGTVRVSYLAVEAASDDGAAAPTGEGLLIAPGASHRVWREPSTRARRSPKPSTCASR